MTTSHSFKPGDRVVCGGFGEIDPDHAAEHHKMGLDWETSTVIKVTPEGGLYVKPDLWPSGQLYVMPHDVTDPTDPTSWLEARHTLPASSRSASSASSSLPPG